MYIIIVITRRRHSMQRSHLLLRALFTPIVHMFIVLFSFMFYVRPKRSYFAAFLQVVSRKGDDGQSALVERLTMPPPSLSNPFDFRLIGVLIPSFLYSVHN